MSLENTYNAEDIKDRVERIEKILIKNKIDSNNLTYSIEPKFDGISVELIYEK
jgi:NAD-dependent DNA ligase